MARDKIFTQANQKNTDGTIRHRIILVLLGWVIAISICGLISGAANASDAAFEQSVLPSHLDEQSHHGEQSLGVKQTLAAGVDAIKRKDYDTALKLWKPLADRNIPVAQYGVAMLYSHRSTALRNDAGDPKSAEGQQQDRDRRAHELFVKAGSKGHIKSLFQLGYQYERGIGTEKDFQKSLFFYRIAAHSHEIHAQVNLAVLFANGHYQKPDIAKAYKWIAVARREALRNPPKAALTKRIDKLFAMIEAKTSYKQRLQAAKTVIKLTGTQI